MRGLLPVLAGAFLAGSTGCTPAQPATPAPPAPEISAAADHELRELYRHLIASENAHDIAEVRRIV